MAYTIEFEPLGRRGECQDTDSILTCARQLGIDIVSICAGKGTCRACKLKVRTGVVSKPTTIESEVFSAQELKDGWRLACQTYPRSDVKVHVPAESMTTPQRTQVEGLEIAVQLEPPVTTYRLKLTAPSLASPEADADQLLQALNEQYQPGCSQVDIEVLRGLSPRLRDWDWQCQATVRHDEVIAAGPASGRQLGLAVDLGTTKIAGYLIDLNSGQALAAAGRMNPQISHGEDIISRITGAVKSTAEASQLQKLVADAITELATELCAEVKASTEEIVEAVVVGNTAMHHLLLGLPVKQLASSPFVAAINAAVDIRSRDLDIPIAPGAYVHLLPNIAGFVGADHVAMLLATKTQWTAGAQLAIDIGTNTEVSLIAGDKITCASCASGPAFEGGHIKDGMRAASGAIERLRIEDGKIEYQTIEGVPAVGICGSGIFDALAQFYRHGIIDRRGRMQDDHSQVRTRKKQREFVLVSKQERNGRPPIVITQQDIRELQLAKAAIQTGIQVLLKANDLSENDLSQVIIAGAFGSYIDVASAITIGMLPSLPLNRFRQVGNAAGMGAKLALVSLSKRTEAQHIAAQAEYIELSTDPNFTEAFINASYLGSASPSEKSSG